MAWVTLSKGGIPPAMSRMICTTVSTTYIRYKICAVSLMRGMSLPTMGPGISARIMWMERPVSVGTMAMMSTRTPMPPIQWVKLRQNSSP